jgi:hypothetical protein
MGKPPADPVSNEDGPRTMDSSTTSELSNAPEFVQVSDCWKVLELEYLADPDCRPEFPGILEIFKA